MTSKELRQKFIEFFKEKGHNVIPSASLVPENDPTALFTSAGMQPLVPYLLGEKHPMGKRLADVQKCIRTDDIDEVGDKVHHTFFEMLGNWSLGDYFKKEAIGWSFEFLTSEKWLGLDKERLAFSVFAGDKDAPFDQEADDKWISLGVSPERIAKLPKKNNWWGPGDSGPCGPDTEMFYWTGSLPVPDSFDHKNENWVEIWNDVFMQYFLKNGKYTPLAQKNVDTGMGLERMTAVINGFDDNYKTDLFLPLIQKISELSGKPYEGNEKDFRIIADHVKAAVFAISDGVSPSNKGAGYVVRRLIRRAIVKANQLGIKEDFTGKMADVVFDIYKDTSYFSHSEANAEESQRSFAKAQDGIKEELEKEESKFRKTLENGLLKLEILSKMWSGLKGNIEKQKATARDMWDLYQSNGFPVELSLEELKRREIDIDDEQIKQIKKLVEIHIEEHQEKSRTASAGMFKGGLAESGDQAIKYHTATHLLLAALQKIVDPNIVQRGSNITSERMRFDFNYPEKLSSEQIKAVEDLVNEQIEKDLPVTMEEMSLNDAKNSGAKGIFDSKYGERVKVYTIESPQSGEAISREICGGPHATRTSELGKFKIKKEESSSAGVRRIKAILE